MMLDIFYQLLKAVVGGMHIFQWLITVIGAKFKGARVKARTSRSLQQVNGLVFMDEMFCCISLYLTLKIFKKYSKVKRWDRSEYWTTCCQIILVMTLLLIKDDLAILQCIQTIINFVHIAQYKSHTNEMLQYMEYAFY